MRAHASTKRGFSAQLEAEHGLTINDYEALLLLARSEDQRLRRVDLAAGLLLTASGITRLLDGLESAGLVDRGTCSTDRRVVYAVLTDAGRARLEAASDSHIAAVRGLFEGRYSEDELTQLADLLGRLPGAEDAAGEDCSVPSA